MSLVSKEERRVYNRAWYAKNKLRINKRTREWMSANPRRVARYRTLCMLRRPFMQLMRDAKNRARAHGLPFDLTKEWAESRWTGHCEMTGLPFESQIGKGNSGQFSPSIDKIVPEKGYTQGNCRFVLLAVNMMKSAGTDEQMYRIAEALVQRGRDVQ
jgi:hypothetical protein